MKIRWYMSILVTMALSALVVASVSTRTARAQGADEEVLTQGPVHEAFAEVVQLTPQPGIVVPREPPAAIEEMPPDERPAGDNVLWIPGYWAWDDDRNDFIWLSGVWRIPPPDCTWVPGYWNPVEGGSQWISGFWGSARTQEVEYLPAVPASLEAGANSPSPGDDYLWSVGYWRWNQNRYLWAPGHWGQVRPGWVSVPPHYIWAGRGCVFVDGYSDYAPEDRGILFAPVYFRNGVYARAGYQYGPTVCLDVANLLSSFFCRPQYGHYYFGDYYDPSYASRGIYPWFARERDHAWYSPFCAYSAWSHEREQPHWLDQVRRDFNDRRDHQELRPAHTYLAFQAQIQRSPTGDRERMSFAKPLTSYVTSSKGPVRFERVNDAARQTFVQQGRERQNVSVQRARLESNMGKSGREFQPSKVRIPSGGTAASTAPSGRSKTGRAEISQPGRESTRTEAAGSETKGRAADNQPKGRRELQAVPSASAGESQTKSRSERGVAAEGAPSEKRDSKQETKGRQELPAAAVRESAPQEKSRSERGSASEGAPSEKRDSKGEAKGQEQPAPRSDQKGGDQKGESRGKQKGDSKDKGGDQGK